MIGGGGSSRVAGRLPRGRFVGFVVTCLVAAVLLEEPLAVRGAAPDLVVIPLVYGAIALGAAGGALLGFGLGIFRDALYLLDFGLHALAMTLLGYGIGKARETLYLTARGADLALLAGAKLALDVVILAVASDGVWVAFERRFFWEAPGAAVFTTLVGAALYRAFAR